MEDRTALHGFIQKIPMLLAEARAALRRRAGPPPVLSGLPPSAKALLRRIVEDDATLRTGTVGGAAIALELRDIIAIYREPSADPKRPFVLAVNGWALEELRRHPEILAA